MASSPWSIAIKICDSIIHLAAQAGVRYSLENPYAYIDANVTGTLVMLDAARRIDNLTAITYASSSSVYGANQKQPFSVEDRVDQPVSLYAATKRSCELIAHTYAHLYGLPATGLRFFTVYGPWGRPDMAAYLFTRAILAGEPIKVFNEGRMARDFTYIDDIVAGTFAATDRPPAASARFPIASTISGTIGQKSSWTSSPFSSGLLGRTARRSCCRYSPAMCRRASPI